MVSEGQRCATGLVRIFFHTKECLNHPPTLIFN